MCSICVHTDGRRERLGWFEMYFQNFEYLFCLRPDDILQYQVAGNLKVSFVARHSQDHCHVWPQHHNEYIFYRRLVAVRQPCCDTTSNLLLRFVRLKKNLVLKHPNTIVVMCRCGQTWYRPSHVTSLTFSKQKWSKFKMKRRTHSVPDPSNLQRIKNFCTICR